MGDKPYGLIITDAGRALIAGWSAGQLKKTLEFAEVQVGSGVPPDGTPREELYTLAGLIEPFAQATSTVPAYDGDRIHMKVQYRSDLNGGLETGRWLSEFGIFIPPPVEGEDYMLFAYGTLGDHPQWVSAHTQGALDIRDFPLVITIGPGVEIDVTYDTSAFMTASDVETYCTIVVLPQFLEHARELIAEHNADAAAHPDIRNLNTDLAGRVARLEDMFVNDISANNFLVAFPNIEGLAVSGVWNKTLERIEF
jgi:hypothetical protein